MRSEKLRAFTRDLLTAAGSDAEEAAVVADVLVWSDRVARANQGVWRLPVLCERLSRGVLRSPCDFRVQQHSPALASVDGGDGQGHYVASRSMREAIAMARREGVGIVTARQSNYYGPGGYYAALAAQESMVGLALSNSFPKVRAFRGDAAVLGTNPLAFACPAQPGQPLVLDMATSELAGSTVRRQEAAAGQEPGSGLLEPLGGAKGFGLGLMVEVLSAVLAGAGIAREVRSMYRDFSVSGNSGHFFLALDIARFMPPEEFNQRMETLLGYLREAGSEVKYPGQQRWTALQRSDSEGISLDPETRAALRDLAGEYGVAAPRELCS